MGVDANGCWMGNWCQDMSLGDSLPSKPNFTLINLSFFNLYQTQSKVAALTSPW